MRRAAPLVGALSAVLAVSAGPGRAAERGALDAEGEAVYQQYCVGCHGVTGDGQGPAAPMLLVKPRDFTKGVFKFRSTGSGELPTDEDLYRIITRGVYRTSMPAWDLLSEQERLAVVTYVKGFYPEWSQRGPGTPVFIAEPPATLGSEASVRRGRELYELLDCTACHGATGRGDGESARNLPPDVWGNPQEPFDFTKGRLKSGPTPKDVYRTFMTGVGGTAMPSYRDIFAEPDDEYIFDGDAWNLVSFILSLRQPVVGGARAAEKESAQ